MLTVPDSGGTEVCVVYEYSVDAKKSDVVLGKMRTGVAKSLADKKCPPLDYSKQSYPGKDYFFLSDNVPLVNAHRVKETVEKGGLAFLKSEQAQRKELAGLPAGGNTPLRVAAIDAAKESECRVKASFFQGRYSACYRAEVYNEALRGGLALHVALNKKGEYVFIQSSYAKP